MNKNLIAALILAAATGCVAKRIHERKGQRAINGFYDILLSKRHVLL